MTNLQKSTESDQLSDSCAESSCSELQQLDIDLESREDSPSVRALAKTRQQEEEVLQIIRQVDALGANTLDLSNKGLLHLPEEVLELKGLENLYLEGNELAYLPEDFFCCLSNLKWLDLRRNFLSRLPTSSIGKHQHLRNLLLEGNNLRTLPLELGFVSTLHGLNITNNPLEFPPLEILEKGTVEVLRFLTEMLEAKSAKFTNGDSILLSKEDSSSDDEWDGSLGEIARMRQRARSKHHQKSAGSNSDIGGLVPHSAELHRPVSYTDIKQQHLEKLKKVGASGKLESAAIRKLLARKRSSKSLLMTPKRIPGHAKGDRRKSGSSVMSWKVNQYPEPPVPEYVDLRMAEERKAAKIRELKEKQDAILQRRRDEQMLKDWREETKKLKQKKYFESVQKGTKDFLDPATQAPYGFDKEQLKMMTNEERIKQDVKTAHERIRRAISPATRQRVEEEKAARIQELERRIKDHTSNMVDRRRRPKGTPQEEMEAAKRELAVADHLHQELLARREELEYRFRAFTADIASSFSNNTRIKH
ncbi:leucine-rich repeat-containing protein 27-like isoform X2 [Haliotis rufescens]|uniref:leucine-rich repeat-containing protein 27-like isoform X2 n=1 Tax=Haliotis rufescens TaxID=6454 RepID=UPI001EB02013|nr:leucine-rich repeat-containing protein 27-like isoform X2 [Haliotis rufescens]